MRFYDKNCDVNNLSPLTLAFVGDTVFDLFVREMLVCQANRSVNKLHKCATEYVKASAQCEIVGRLMPHLTEKEVSVFKRGRNAKTHFSPSHGELIQYRRATGFEALFGYLHMSGNKERAKEIFDIAYDGVFEKMLEKIK